MAMILGIYRANLECKHYVLLTGIRYKYKIRLRPDLAVVKPVTLQQFTFLNRTIECPRSVLYPNPSIFQVGAEDSFNIGLSEDMDALLDRYTDLTTNQFYYKSWHGKWFWTSESYLFALLKERYNICLDADFDLWLVVIRRNNHKLIFKEVLSDRNYWIRSPHK